ncbi:fimbrial protein [Burkholderia ubonensis]|uniref:Fimbrial protein n=2 Tax=Burkholderia ubonensis TaxID=101571 RepID=A0AB73G9F4_9BURK|nr:fimbrial protein [Burkholderia ubonensis]KVC69142.1 fimbrial protein [Burkholderia ubonensis]KVC86888.1 fimbrial protein [Burkholderia ubonensis]KVG70520.1 fimbrial protein [Burkholderia ubonensis]KVH21931.1 fimbrial protein [Burkholderia ubonensis]KVH45146.1 fimbrial protein [Burkholderia ubonensis]
MKKIAMMMSVAGLSIAAMSAAHASDGTINFTGSVVASTCKINEGVNDLAVTLPKASTNQLAAAGATAGRTPFKLTLTGCTTDKEEGGTTIPAPVNKVSVAFEPGPNVNLATGRLTLTGADAAKNVEIGILNDKYEPIKVGAESSAQNSQIVDIDTTAGTATLQYSAQYVATGEATGGSANSFVTYSLIYP